MLPALFVAGFIWFNLARHTSSLFEPISEIAAHPRMLMISSDLGVGHPLVRQLGGEWVARPGHLWIAGGAFHLLTNETPDVATRAELRRLAAQDRDALVEDIEREKPDIIVVDRQKFDWMQWARWDEHVNRALGVYREAAAPKGFVILKRKGDSSTTATSER
jgi:hypothetical protein